MFTIRKSEDRGYANFGWLEARYSFSFARYYDPNFVGFGDLLVINEDFIAPGMGFDTHSHKDMEIISYIVEGGLYHKDSMGNDGLVRPGEIQYMSAGTGVSHSEYNGLKDERTWSIQIWIQPDANGQQPQYGQTSYLERLVDNKLCLLASGDGREESVKIHQNAFLYTARLKTGNEIYYSFGAKRKGWLQLVKGKLEVEGHVLGPGDALAITDEKEARIQANEDSEFLFFDLKE